MAEVVYALCAIASIFCAWLLVANYRRTRVRLALWTSLCFVGLALNNVLLVIDLVVLPGNHLLAWRTLVALAAMGTLVFGLVWEET
jgi:hypothetical protein